MDRIAYTLKYPFETLSRDRDGAETSTKIETLALAPRVKGRHMRSIDKASGAIEAKLMLIASLANITRAEADELDEVDVLAIDAIYDEDSDLSQLARDLDLPPEASIDALRAAIAELKERKGLEVPLDGGVGRSEDGPATGQPSSAT